MCRPWYIGKLKDVEIMCCVEYVMCTQDHDVF